MWTRRQRQMCIRDSFMAGLGIGSAWAGRRVEQFRRPLLAYGMIELGIAAFGAFSAPFLLYTSEILDPLLWFD